MDRRGQVSVDALFAIGIFSLAVAFVVVTVSTSFAGCKPNVKVLVAERVATLLCEDAGINATPFLETNWEVNGTINISARDWLNARGTTIKRVGLAEDERMFETAYIRCVPNVLNWKKVEAFFNETWWSSPDRFNGQRNVELYRNLSYLIGCPGYCWNVTLSYPNGTLIYSIGYPVPKWGDIAVVKRLVLIDKDVYPLIDNNNFTNAPIRILTVYVW